MLDRKLFDYCVYYKHIGRYLLIKIKQIKHQASSTILSI